MPATIFVTAYDQHALKAFEVAAVDYLVKPFDDERFSQALARARERIRLRRRRADDAAAAGGDRPPAASPPPRRRRPLRGRRTSAAHPGGEPRPGRASSPSADIDYVSASGPYAELHVGGQAHLIRERMQALEERLDPARFFRIHRSAIVQLDRVESLQSARRRRGRPPAHGRGAAGGAQPAGGAGRLAELAGVSSVH